MQPHLSHIYGVFNVIGGERAPRLGRLAEGLATASGSQDLRSR